MGAVLAANRFNRLLATGFTKGGQDGAVSTNDDQPEEIGTTKKIAEDPEQSPRPEEEQRLAPSSGEVVAILEK